MGVYITGIRISETCSGCDLKLWAKCVPAKRDVPLYADNQYHPRPNWCPATQIPPHGRLVDADVVYDKIAEADHAGNYVDMDAVGSAMEEVPTVIEADG